MIFFHAPNHFIIRCSNNTLIILLVQLKYSRNRNYIINFMIINLFHFIIVYYQIIFEITK